jgi:hypothetical protein
LVPGKEMTQIVAVATHNDERPDAQ